jgi:NAD(P)-dependent dehydrogenase (short-subunit alcohol dehydrogenase family)
MQGSGKTIIVTGASSGIGAAAVTALTGAGCKVVATARDAEKLSALYGADGNVAALPWDLSDPERIADYANEAGELAGPVAGLVHCAGAQDVSPLHLTKPALLDRVFRLNTYAAVLLVSFFSKKGKYADGASFVLISSLSAHEGTRGRSVYAASKAALEGYAVAAAPELAEKGIRINCIAPGIVRTPAVDGFFKQLTDEQKDALLTEYPLGIGEPEDVAHLIEYLISDRARWITGQVLKPDGGHLSR